MARQKLALCVAILLAGLFCIANGHKMVKVRMPNRPVNVMFSSLQKSNSKTRSQFVKCCNGSFCNTLAIISNKIHKDKINKRKKSTTNIPRMPATYVERGRGRKNTKNVPFGARPSEDKSSASPEGGGNASAERKGSSPGTSADDPEVDPGGSSVPEAGKDSPVDASNKEEPLSSSEDASADAAGGSVAENVDSESSDPSLSTKEESSPGKEKVAEPQGSDSETGVVGGESGVVAGAEGTVNSQPEAAITKSGAVFVASVSTKEAESTKYTTEVKKMQVPSSSTLKPAVAGTTTTKNPANISLTTTLRTVKADSTTSTKAETASESLQTKIENTDSASSTSRSSTTTTRIAPETTMYSNSTIMTSTSNVMSSTSTSIMSSTSTSRMSTSRSTTARPTPAMFARRRRRKRAAPTAVDGTFTRACNKTYFFGSNPVSWGDSYAACKDFGMLSVGIGTPEKQKCVTDAANSDARTTNKSFWSSGHKKGASCPKTYAMCDANEVIGPDISSLLGWAGLLGEDPDKDMCLSLALMAGAPSGLSHAFCDKKLNIMCEPKCAKPECPLTCTEDPKKLDKAGMPKDLTVGDWVETPKYYYMFMTATEGWNRAWEDCCKIGMRLIGFETPSKITDLMAAVQALQFKTVGKFWISGSQRNCIGVFHYCYSDVPVEKDAPWITGQPDNFGGNMDHIYAVISRTNVLVDDEQEKTKFRYICVKPK